MDAAEVQHKNAVQMQYSQDDRSRSIGEASGLASKTRSFTLFVSGGFCAKNRLNSFGADMFGRFRKTGDSKADS